jgi:hypothetical protein
MEPMVESGIGRGRSGFLMVGKHVAKVRCSSFVNPRHQSATFQIFTVLSEPEDANRFPSGLNATPLMPL